MVDVKKSVEKPPCKGFLSSAELIEESGGYSELGMRVDIFSRVLSRRYGVNFQLCDWQCLPGNGCRSITLAFGVSDIYSVGRILDYRLDKKRYQIASSSYDQQLHLTCKLNDFDDLWLDLMGLRVSQNAQIKDFPRDVESNLEQDISLEVAEKVSAVQ